MCARSCSSSSISVCSFWGLFDKVSTVEPCCDGGVAGGTHCTPEGWRAVLLTLLATIVLMDLFNELEWKLLFACFWIA